MKTKYTPGPWELVRTEKGELELGGGIEQSTGVYSGAGFGLIANVIYKKTNILGDSKVLQKQTFEANATLISAAPDMLEALIKAERLITMMLTEVYREEIQRYLSGGFKEFVENASLKDSLGVSAAIKKAQP